MASSSTSAFVLEIGSEELPSRFLQGEEAYLAEAFARALDEAGLAHGNITCHSTPRRAIVCIDEVARRQEEREEVIMGPPARVAYVDGKPGKALEGFCRTNGVEMDKAYVVSTPKGDYVAVKKLVGGGNALDILAGICPDIIAHIPFAKRMRWADHDFAYARPLQWIVALLDDEIVPFKVGPMESGRVTSGHRIHGRGPFEVARAQDLLPLLSKQGAVMPDGNERRELVVREGNAQAERVQGRILWDDALLQEVTGLVEHPVPLLGDFDTTYLEVPREVLITSMQSHQKSFGVEDAEGNLLPHFLTVLNIEPESLELVKHGWERVLRARLEDARFFWHEDLKIGFDAWLAKLEHVIFIRGLGTMGDKSRRLEALCGWLAEKCAPDMQDKCMRAGKLAKADLVSGMVGEFDTLQGIMGGIYAEKWGEDPVVAKALKEQYLPAGPDSPLPETVAGALLAVADKADTMAGCFGLNLCPSGTADPNGLRRCAIGIIRILRKFGFALDVRELFARAQMGYGEREWKVNPTQCLDKLDEFFKTRLRSFYQGLGVNTLLVDAALGANCRTVKGVDERVEALKAFSSSEGYASSVQTFKRVANIVAKHVAEERDIPATWKKSLLKEDAEKSLAKVLEEALPILNHLWEAHDYSGILAQLEKLRPHLDNFFDHVMVACDDAELCANRLAMLKSLSDRFSRVADFAALQI